MLLPLLGALGSAVCYGGGSVLQALGARRAPSRAGLDPRLVLRAIRQGPYVGGIALDLLGFGLSLAALRGLPLFVVEAAVSSNVAVIAVLSVPMLGERLRRVDGAAIVAVVGGLAVLATAAVAGPAAPVGTTLRWATAGAAVVALLAGVPAARMTGAVGATVLGTLAGLAFGAVGVGARVIRNPLQLHTLMSDPAVLAVIVGGLGGILLYTTALQRGSVTGATGALVVAETAVPAGVGLLWLGDRARPGWAVPAAAGFLLAVAGAVLLAGVVGSGSLDETAGRGSG